MAKGKKTAGGKRTTAADQVTQIVPATEPMSAYFEELDDDDSAMVVEEAVQCWGLTAAGLVVGLFASAAGWSNGALERTDDFPNFLGFAPPDSHGFFEGRLQDEDAEEDD